MTKKTHPCAQESDAVGTQRMLLEAIQRIAQIGGWELDLRTEVLTWTDETYRIHGVTRAEYSPSIESAIAFYTRQAQPVIRRALEEARKQAIRFDLDLQIVRKDGAIRWVRAVGRREDQEGHTNRVCGVFQDITERRALEQEVVSIAQREQNRIAFDLHDGLGQQLTGIALLLHGVSAETPVPAAAFQEKIRRIEMLTREAISTCRSVAEGLSPVQSVYGGLKRRVRQLAIELEDLHVAKIQLRIRGGEVLLEDAVADHLYRIIQEAATNAIKHAHPRRIDIRVDYMPARVLVSITNDGEGIAASRPEGMGLKIMEYRARVIGATLVIRQLASGGTRVFCSLPHANTFEAQPENAALELPSVRT